MFAYAIKFKRMDEKAEKLILCRADLLKMENQLCASLMPFFSFSGHSLFFPPESMELSYLAGEKKLFVPLDYCGANLGAILFEGVRAAEARKIMPFLPGIVALCLDKLALEIKSRKDTATGLDSEATFFQHIIREGGSLRAALSDPGHMDRDAYKMCLGLLVISWRDARRMADDFDYDFCWKIYLELANAIDDCFHDEAVVAPLGGFEGRYEFGALFSATGRGGCYKAAAALMEKLEKLSFLDAVSGRGIRPCLVIGHAQYPQDMRGGELRLPMREQAIRLRDRARYAAHAAADGKIMAYAQILKKGGRIMENLGEGKVRVNLGLAANAREGLRFQVLSARDGTDKGQIVILNTRARDSVAEILYLDQAGFIPEPGDRLVLLGATAAENSAASVDGSSDYQGRLLSHADFLKAFAEKCKDYPAFTLGISKFAPENADAIINVEAMANAMPHDPEPLLAGFYGGDGLIFLHAEADKAKIFYEKLHATVAGAAFSGLFSWPFLNFSKLDSENCALKALEYARLLPEPHIGVLDSLALNISADKKYSFGDVFGAISEYKLALLADAANAMARNSLGVCLAALGKMEDAKKLLAKALDDAHENGLKARVCYNLGAIWQKQNDFAAARRFYKKCVRLDPAHFYGWIKLGRLNENSRGKAREYYLRAADLAGEDPVLANVARRHLARVEVRSSGMEKARALLHDALLHDPQDSASMLLMAKMYLDNDEDPQMAEALARKSVALDGNPDGWLTLAKALDAQGKSGEAERARLRAEKRL